MGAPEYMLEMFGKDKSMSKPDKHECNRGYQCGKFDVNDKYSNDVSEVARKLRKLVNEKSEYSPLLSMFDT